MGLPVEIYKTAAYRPPRSNVVSHDHDEAVLVDLPGTTRESADRPGLVIVKRHLREGPYLHAEPDFPPSRGHIGWMFGGTFIHGSSSMGFPSEYPIPLHDRMETVEDYDLLSR